MNTRILAISARPHRVTTLVSICILLAAVDLAITVQQMGSTGLLEANPLARTIAEAGPAALIAWKLGVTAFHALALLSLRRRLSAELGAWVSVAILSWPIVLWHGYLGEIADLPVEQWSAQIRSDPNFVLWSPTA